MSKSPFRLFDCFGIELEYMIVDRTTLAVKPLCDRLLEQVGGGYETEVERGDLAWSNELALHVVELKTNGPVKSLTGLASRFAEHVQEINAMLAPMSACLLPTGMHPTMDPDRELKLWPHENDHIYRAFDRIFNCKGHGWANLQSMHINLPFADDAEFARLHAAIRLVLPILPALAASSPFVEGKARGCADMRLSYYRHNADSVPSVAGQVVPEPVFSKAAYEREILQKIYADMAPLDPEGILRNEWVNARGAIARFDRNAIEIRLLDVQECPAADLAIAEAVIAVVRSLVQETHSTLAQQQRWETGRLSAILNECVTHGDTTVLNDSEYLALLGLSETKLSAGQVWQALVERYLRPEPRAAIAGVVANGCLSSRIRTATGPAPDAERLAVVYHQLADCLQTGRLFQPSS
jgi:glutamate---cysteine ligase / carboxylate-amine ligase